MFAAPRNVRPQGLRLKRSIASMLMLLLLVLGTSWPSSSKAQLRDGLGVAYGSPPAPALVVETLEGGRFDLSAQRAKVVVINFWATWCPPCVEELPALSRLWRKLGDDGLLVLAISVGESDETVRQFLAKFEPTLSFPIGVNLSATTLELWGVQGLPVTYVVNKTGNIIYSARGARQMDSEHITQRLRALLDE